MVQIWFRVIASVHTMVESNIVTVCWCDIDNVILL